MAELIHLSLFNDASLKFYWRFEGNSNDSKGSNNGTDSNMSYGTGSGKYGQGANFNGTNGSIALTTFSLSTAFTFLSWCNFSTPPSGGSALLVGDFDYAGSNSYQGAGIGLNTSGIPFVISGNNTGRSQGTNWQQATGSAINDGNWHNVAGVYDTANLILYVDGVAVSTVAWTNNPSEKPNAIMGTLTDSTARFYNGNLDDSAYFSRALTSQEIKTVFQGGGGFFTFMQ